MAKKVVKKGTSKNTKKVEVKKEAVKTVDIEEEKIKEVEVEKVEEKRNPPKRINPKVMALLYLLCSVCWIVSGILEVKAKTSGVLSFVVGGLLLLLAVFYFIKSNKK